MKEIELQIVREFRSRLETIIPILDLRIFGSRARGDEREDSDLDLFIKVDKLDRALREKIHNLAWEIGFEKNLLISTFVVSETDVKTGTVGASPLYAKVIKEGIIV